MQIDAGQKPVPILPIILYHGKEKWVVEPFDSYFGDVEAEMLRFLPCFDYILINLQDYSDEFIKKLESIFLQKMFLAFKHYWDKQYLEMHIIELLFQDFSNPKNEQIRSFILKMGVYLRAISGITREEIIAKVNQSNNNLKPEAMSIFEEFIEEGKEIGKDLGIYQEKKRMVIFLYKKRKTIKSIAEYVDFPIEKVKKIIAEYLKLQQQQPQSN